MLRLLLSIFPRSFRKRFGSDLIDLIADRRRSAGAAGARATAAFWVRTIVDLSAHGLAERRAARRLARTGGDSMLSSLAQDVRYAIRTYRHRPGFTGVALATLALGIGANTAIFSVVEAVLLRPLPYADAGRIVRVYETYPRFELVRGVTSPFVFDTWERDARSFEAVAALRASTATLTGAGDPRRVGVQFVMPAFFEVMGVQPMLGRVLTREDADTGQPVAVLSHDLWAASFETDDDVLGRPIVLDAQTYTVVGVMPAGFLYPARTDVYRPLALTAAMRQAIGSYHLGAVARLAPGVSVEAAQAEVDALSARLETQHPSARSGRGAAVVALRDDLTERVAGSLRVLQGVVLFVLLIACANVANLGLAGASARRREIGIRASIGASRGRLARQWLTEHVILAVSGAALGLLLATWVARALFAIAPSGLLPAGAAPAINVTVLAFTFVLALATGLVAGVAPACFHSGRDALDAIKDGGAGSTGGARRGQRWLRHGLVAAEVALALVLIAGSLLLVRSFARLTSRDPGFDTSRLLTAQITLPAARYDGPDAQRAFWRALFDRLGALSGVVSATGSTALPFSNWQWQTWFELDGGQIEGAETGSGTRTITPGYFSTLGIPIHQGRDFTDADRMSAEPVVIVNDAFVRRFIGGNPIGRRLRTERPGASGGTAVIIGVGQGPEYSARWATIVGVAASARHGRLDEQPEPEIYRPLSQSSASSLILALRAAGDAVALTPLLREAVRAIDRDLPLQAVRTMDDAIGQTTARRTFDLRLMTGFALLAAALATAGIYGVTAFVAGLRTREAGIRLALGARPGQVQGLFLRQAAAPVGVGVSIGLLAALALGDVLRQQLFEIQPHDPMTLAASAVLFLTVGLTAASLPARRVGRVNPTVTLRGE